MAFKLVTKADPAFANKHGMAVDIVALAKKKKRQEADE
jgi:hypothetical protein